MLCRLCRPVKLALGARRRKRIAGCVAAALTATESLDFLVGFYAFGAMLAFTIAHLSVVRLR